MTGQMTYWLSSPLMSNGTAVSACAGRFRHPKLVDIVLNRQTELHVQTVNAGGQLTSVFKQPLFCRLHQLKTVPFSSNRTQATGLDHLVAVLETGSLVVLSYNHQLNRFAVATEVLLSPGGATEPNRLGNLLAVSSTGCCLAVTAARGRFAVIGITHTTEGVTLGQPVVYAAAALKVAGAIGLSDDHSTLERMVDIAFFSGSSCPAGQGAAAQLQHLALLSHRDNETFSELFLFAWNSVRQQLQRIGVMMMSQVHSLGQSLHLLPMPSCCTAMMVIGGDFIVGLDCNGILQQCGNMQEAAKLQLLAMDIIDHYTVNDSGDAGFEQTQQTLHTAHHVKLTVTMAKCITAVLCEPTLTASRVIGHSADSRTPATRLQVLSHVQEHEVPAYQPVAANEVLQEDMGNTQPGAAAADVPLRDNLQNIQQRIGIAATDNPLHNDTQTNNLQQGLQDIEVQAAGPQALPQVEQLVAEANAVGTGVQQAGVLEHVLVEAENEFVLADNGTDSVAGSETENDTMGEQGYATALSSEEGESSGEDGEHSSQPSCPVGRLASAGYMGTMRTLRAPTLLSAWAWQCHWTGSFAAQDALLVATATGNLLALYFQVQAANNSNTSLQLLPPATSTSHRWQAAAQYITHMRLFTWQAQEGAANVLLALPNSRLLMVCDSGSSLLVLGQHGSQQLAMVAAPAQQQEEQEKQQGELSTSNLQVHSLANAIAAASVATPEAGQALQELHGHEQHTDTAAPQHQCAAAPAATAAAFAGVMSAGAASRTASPAARLGNLHIDSSAATSNGISLDCNADMNLDSPVSDDQASPLAAATGLAAAEQAAFLPVAWPPAAAQHLIASGSTPKAAGRRRWAARRSSPNQLAVQGTAENCGGQLIAVDIGIQSVVSSEHQGHSSQQQDLLADSLWQPKMVASGSQYHVLDQIQLLGPIGSFTVLDRHSQMPLAHASEREPSSGSSGTIDRPGVSVARQHLVAASSKASGGLQVVKLGIPTESVLAGPVDMLLGASALWPVTWSPSNEQHAALVISFLAGSRALSVNERLQDVTEQIGLVSTEPTLLSAAIAEGLAVQVTPSGVQLCGLGELQAHQSHSNIMQRQGRSRADRHMQQRRSQSQPDDAASPMRKAVNNSLCRWSVQEWTQLQQTAMPPVFGEQQQLQQPTIVVAAAAAAAVVAYLSSQELVLLLAGFEEQQQQCLPAMHGNSSAAAGTAAVDSDTTERHGDSGEAVDSSLERPTASSRSKKRSRGCWQLQMSGRLLIDQQVSSLQICAAQHSTASTLSFSALYTTSRELAAPVETLDIAAASPMPQGHSQDPAAHVAIQQYSHYIIVGQYDGSIRLLAAVGGSSNGSGSIQALAVFESEQLHPSTLLAQVLTRLSSKSGSSRQATGAAAALGTVQQLLAPVPDNCVILQPPVTSSNGSLDMMQQPHARAAAAARGACCPRAGSIMFLVSYRNGDVLLYDLDLVVLCQSSVHDLGREALLSGPSSATDGPTCLRLLSQLRLPGAPVKLQLLGVPTHQCCWGTPSGQCHNATQQVLAVGDAVWLLQINRQTQQLKSQLVDTPGVLLAAGLLLRPTAVFSEQSHNGTAAAEQRLTWQQENGVQQQQQHNSQCLCQPVSRNVSKSGQPRSAGTSGSYSSNSSRADAAAPAGAGAVTYSSGLSRTASRCYVTCVQQGGQLELIELPPAASLAGQLQGWSARNMHCWLPGVHVQQLLHHPESGTLLAVCGPGPKSALVGQSLGAQDHQPASSGDASQQSPADTPTAAAFAGDGGGAAGVAALAAGSNTAGFGNDSAVTGHWLECVDATCGASFASYQISNKQFITCMGLWKATKAAFARSAQHSTAQQQQQQPHQHAASHNVDIANSSTSGSTHRMQQEWQRQQQQQPWQLVAQAVNGAAATRQLANAVIHGFADRMIQAGSSRHHQPHCQPGSGRPGADSSLPPAAVPAAVPAPHRVGSLVVLGTELAKADDDGCKGQVLVLQLVHSYQAAAAPVPLSQAARTVPSTAAMGADAAAMVCQHSLQQVARLRMPESVSAVAGYSPNLLLIAVGHVLAVYKVHGEKLLQAAHCFVRAPITSLAVAAPASGLVMAGDMLQGLVAYQVKVHAATGQVSLQALAAHSDVRQVKQAACLPPLPVTCQKQQQHAGDLNSTISSSSSRAAGSTTERPQERGQAVAGTHGLCLDSKGFLLEVGWARQRTVPVKVLTTLASVPLDGAPTALQMASAAAAAVPAVPNGGHSSPSVPCVGGTAGKQQICVYAATEIGSILQLQRLAAAEGRALHHVQQVLLQHPLTRSMCIGSAKLLMQEEQQLHSSNIGTLSGPIGPMLSQRYNPAVWQTSVVADGCDGAFLGMPPARLGAIDSRVLSVLLLLPRELQLQLLANAGLVELLVPSRRQRRIVFRGQCGVQMQLQLCEAWLCQLQQALPDCWDC